MHTRVVLSTLRSGKTEEAIRIFRDTILPVTKQQGFKGVLLMVDSNAGKGLAITFWETEADLLASETSGVLQEQFAKLGQVIAAPPAIENYEVVFQV